LLQRALTTDERATLSAADLEQIQQFCMQTLGGLPLALNQAGAYIEQTRCSLRGYIQRFEQHAMKLLAKPGDAHDPVATTFDLSLKQVEKRKPAAVELLRICAFLDSDQIAEEIFQAWTWNNLIRQYISSARLWKRLQNAFTLLIAAIRGKPLATNDRLLSELASDPLKFDEAIEALLRYSLIKRDETGLSMHRLLQRVVRHQLPQPKEYAERAVNAVNAVFPYPEFENWATCERLLPSALVCCQNIKTYAIQTGTAGRLLNETAYYLYQKANYEEALPLYQEVLKIDEQVLGKQHPYYAQSLNNLAGLYRAQGQYEQALPLNQEALKIREQVLGKLHPDYATSLNDLALLYYLQGQYEEALPLYQKALKIKEQVLGKLHPYYASSLSGLAALYDSQGQYEEALPLFQEALKIKEQVLGKQHPNTALSIWWLATYYERIQDDEQALPLYQEALRIFTHALGEQHPDTKRVKGNYERCLNRDS